MRKIGEAMVAAIRDRKSVDLGNTRVICAPNEITVTLLGNEIFRQTFERKQVTLAGWNTNTTRTRVNAILAEVSPKHTILSKKGQAYLKTGEGASKKISNDVWISV